MSDQIQSRTARRQAQQKQNKKNKKPKKGFFKKIFLAVVLIGFLGLLGGGGLFVYYASTAPKLDEKLLRDPLSSDILYASGDLMYTTGAEKREYVNYEDIPELMENAILATEDVRFYKHHGIDFYRLGGAVLANVRRGFGAEGASTISQQVIKNSFFSNDKTLKRKAQEAWLAFQLERNYEKEEIFEMYFNKILMSRNNYGFGTAAAYFYGKPLNELELHEVAMLAGLPQSPNGYNPNVNPDRAKKRRDIVLKLMHQHKKITKEEMESAQAVDVTSTLLPEEERVANNFKYPALLDVVLDELEEAGLGDIIDEGVQIQTTFDEQAQAIVEKTISNSAYYVDDKIEGAMTVLDTKTGGIVAIGGGRNYTTGLNFARQDKRQLGSTMKPILAYGPAIEHLKWSTGQVVVDEPFKYKSGQSLGNAYPGFKGSLTIREGLYDSSNVTAVKTFNEVGHGNALQFASKLGIDLSDIGESNVLGGTTETFSTIDLAGAYAAFGNGGIYTKPHAINKIIARDGKEMNSIKPKSSVAMKESTAYMVTDMLRDVFTKGTGKYANVSGLDMAGKTGTTNEAVDSWFAGYSTNYTIAAWGGYQDRTPMTGWQGQRYIPQDLFREVMAGISANKQTPRFQMPSSVEEVDIVYLSNPIVRANASTPANMRRTELFVKDTIPKKVEKVETLNAPSNLNATFNEDDESIVLTWEHARPETDKDGEVQFIVNASVDGGEAQEMTTTSDFSLTFPGAEQGKTYTFTVTAVLGDLKSDSASVTLEIEGNEEEEEEDPEEDLEGEEPDEDEDLTPSEDDNSSNENDEDQKDESDEKENEQEQGNRDEDDLEDENKEQEPNNEQDNEKEQDES